MPRDRKHLSTTRLAAAAAVVLAACSSPPPPPPGLPRSEVEALVARDAVFAQAETVPDPLVDALGGARVVLLGETHYVEEHQHFVAALVARLHAAGFRAVVDEQMHATAWTGEEYVMLRSATLPPQLARLDQALLDGLRAFNATVAEADRIHFAGFDMNHWPDVFQAGAAELQLRFGHVAALDDVLAAAPGSAAYAAALDALPARLEADRAAIEAAVGAERHALLAEMVEVERRSAPLRASMDYTTREGIIRERVAAALARAGTAGVVVNCGADHAQRETLMGPVREVVGTWLGHHPELYGGDPALLRTVAFGGARGSLLAHFYDTVPATFDVVRDAPENSLARVLAERAGARLAWLPLGDPAWSAHDVNYTGGKLGAVLPIGRQFDGLVLYPTVSVLRSLSQ